MTGRFAQADTIVPDTGNVQAWDRYAYANNNPAKYIDPTGHFSEKEIAEMWGFKNIEEMKKSKLWKTWSENGFRDLLLNAKWGDILTLKSGKSEFSFMFGQTEDGGLGFWEINTKMYWNKDNVNTLAESSESWALFTRDATQNKKNDDYFDSYTPTPWKKGDGLPTPELQVYWAGGVDSNHGYV